MGRVPEMARVSEPGKVRAMAQELAWAVGQAWVRGRAAALAKGPEQAWVPEPVQGRVWVQGSAWAQGRAAPGEYCRRCLRRYPPNPCRTPMNPLKRIPLLGRGPERAQVLVPVLARVLVRGRVRAMHPRPDAGWGPGWLAQACRGETGAETRHHCRCPDCRAGKCPNENRRGVNARSSASGRVHRPAGCCRWHRGCLTGLPHPRLARCQRRHQHVFRSLRCCSAVMARCCRMRWI